MSRPETPADIDEHYRRGHRVAEFHRNTSPDTPPSGCISSPHSLRLNASDFR